MLSGERKNLGTFADLTSYLPTSQVDVYIIAYSWSFVKFSY